MTMESFYNIVEIVENQRVGFNVPKQLDIAYSKLKCLAGDLKFFYSAHHERLSCPVFVSKFCPAKNQEHLLISANEEGDVILMDTNAPKGKKIVASLKAHDNAIFDVAWCYGDLNFITAAGDQSAHLWQLVEGTVTLVHHFLGHTHSVKAISCRPDDSGVFATGGRDGTLIVWDKRIHLPAQDIETKIIEPYKVINHSHEDNSIFKARSRGYQKNSVTGLVFQDENNLISCSAGDGLIKVWDMRKSYAVKKRLPVPKHIMDYGGQGKNGFSYLAISPCRLRLYANCIDDHVYSYNIGTYAPKPIAAYCGGPQGTSFYIKNSVSPDGKYIATGSTDGKAYIWSVKNQLAPVVSLSGHAAEVTCVDWCKSGLLKMATSSDDATFRVWRLQPEERACNDPMLKGWAERHHVRSSRRIRKIPSSSLKKRKYYISDGSKTPIKSSSVQDENLSPEIHQAEKKHCRNVGSLDMSSLTANLPNFVIDGTSPHHHQCSPYPPKPKETNWLAKLRERANISPKTQQIIARRKSSSNSPSSAKGSLLKFFKKASRTPTCEQSNVPPTDTNSKLPSIEV